MDRREAENCLAALLDGELRDPRQIAELNALLERDPALRAEYESQRALKAALGGLAPSEQQLEQQAPAFLATRVMGEIAARRNAPRPSLWRPVVTWSGSLAALLVGFFTTVQLMQPAVDTAALTAQGPAVPAAQPAVPAGLTMNVRYAPDYWNNLSVPAGTDERVSDFLKFANEAHNYRRLMRSGDDTTPDMAQAVMAVNSGDTNVVWTADEK